ncbi:MAG: hypothetical protein QM731_19565 [Chitinophagaceae bacterium]
MKPVATLLLGLLLFTACSKNEQTKDLPASVQKLIDENTNCICLPKLDERSYQSKTVYNLYYLGPNCNTISTIYDDKGTLLTRSYEPLYVSIMGNSALVRNVWSCEKSDN